LWDINVLTFEAVDRQHKSLKSLDFAGHSTIPAAKPLTVKQPVVPSFQRLVGAGFFRTHHLAIATTNVGNVKMPESQTATQTSC
jgi:hypothetical protein